MLCGSHENAIKTIQLYMAPLVKKRCLTPDWSLTFWVVAFAKTHRWTRCCSPGNESSSDNDIDISNVNLVSSPSDDVSKVVI